MMPAEVKHTQYHAPPDPLQAQVELLLCLAFTHRVEVFRFTGLLQHSDSKEVTGLALSKERKEQLIAEYTDLLQRSKAVIFTEYSGMDNSRLTRLRNEIRKSNGVYRVVKLTLFKRALEATGYSIPETLSGVPLGVGFCLQDIPPIAKSLIDFAKEAEQVAIRGGIAPDQVYSSDDVKAIAELPSLDVLQAQLLGLLDMPASGLVGVIQGGVASIVNVVHAYVEKAEGAA